MRKLHDKYFRLAKREGRLARSFYKLEEIDRRARVLKRGDRILDLGACPGSWLEYSLQRIGPGGIACAVDLNVIDKRFKDTVTFRKKDVLEITPDDFAGVAETFDVILSDMAPRTSGVKATDQARSLELCEAALDVAGRMLVRGGHFVCKIFEGPDSPAFRRELADRFATIRTIKPDASRDESMETYYVAHGYGVTESQLKKLVAKVRRGGRRPPSRKR